MSKLRTLFWYLRRPQLLPQLYRVMTERLLSDEVDNKSISSLEECRSNAITPSDFYKKFGIDAPIEIEKNYHELTAKAKERTEKCPVEMGGPGAIDLIFNLCRYLDVTTVLETGVAYGWSSLSILLHLNQKHEGRLYSVDMPYPNLGNDQYVGVAVPEEFKKKWKIFRMADREAIPRILKACQMLDFVHYDSDKTYEGKMWTFNKIWPKLRMGGCLMSDDVSDNFAFLNFCKSIEKEPTIIRCDYMEIERYVGVLTK